VSSELGDGRKVYKLARPRQFWYSARVKQLISALLLFITLSLNAQDYAANIASLIDPAKLATLRERGANPRIQKCVYWLEEARKAGKNATNVAHDAVSKAGYKNSAAVLTEQSLLRNLDIATKLGCLDKEGLSKMRHGNPPTVHTGPYAGDVASVDHIVPRAVCPQLDNCIANLELLQIRMNESKKVEDR